MSQLFSPLRLRGVIFRNRIFVSPMCQYSSENGMPTDWHLVHLGSRAVGGAAMVMVEATAVSPEGRISPWDSGLWSQEHARAFSRIVEFVKSQGAVPAIQLAHAGRKASVDAPWRGGKPLSAAEGGWTPIAPSAVPFDKGHPMPRQMSEVDLDGVRKSFVHSAQFSMQAGFEVIELHIAHGYLLHEFLSPLSNTRSDVSGGSLENRMRFPLSVARAVREVLPTQMPLLARISASDWMPDGWDLPQSIQLCQRLKEIGVDLIDCSSGGMVPNAKIELGPGYQVPFSKSIRREVGIATGAVGLITDPRQAEEIIATGKADAVLLAREFLRDPYWPQRAAAELGAQAPWPPQYGRARRGK